MIMSPKSCCSHHFTPLTPSFFELNNCLEADSYRGSDLIGICRHSMPLLHNLQVQHILLQPFLKINTQPSFNRKLIDSKNCQSKYIYTSIG